MKNRIILTVAAGVCALAGLSANANTIGIGAATVVIGGGGTFADYTYPIRAENATVNTIDPSFININDFGLGVVQANTVPGTWSFTQPFVGPNTGAIGVDSPTVEDAVFTLTSGAGAIPDGLYSITIRTLLTGVGGVSPYSTSDRQTAGIAAGQPSAAQGFVRSPVGSVREVPDGGTTVALLGFALAGLAGLRRKLTA